MSGSEDEYEDGSDYDDEGDYSDEDGYEYDDVDPNATGAAGGAGVHGAAGAGAANGGKAGKTKAGRFRGPIPDEFLYRMFAHMFNRESLFERRQAIRALRACLQRARMRTASLASVQTAARVAVHALASVPATNLGARAHCSLVIVCN